jgi:ABC-2 type transport system permease protein
MGRHGLGALIGVELKKLVRDPMSLSVLLLMPVALALIFALALGGVRNDAYYYPVPGMSHFEYLLPGVMGYAVIYMGMIVALSLVDYRKAGLLKRIGTTPVTPSTTVASQVVANMVIAVAQALIVLLLAWLLGFRPEGGAVGLLIGSLALALLAVTAVGLGLITAAVSNDSGAAGGLSVIFILPMMMFGTLLAVFSEPTRAIARFMPNFYATDTLSIVLHTGNLGDPMIVRNLLILAAIGIVVVAIGIQVFRRTAYR